MIGVVISEEVPPQPRVMLLLNPVSRDKQYRVSTVVCNQKCSCSCGLEVCHDPTCAPILTGLRGIRTENGGRPSYTLSSRHPSS